MEKSLVQYGKEICKSDSFNFLKSLKSKFLIVIINS